MSEYEYDKSGVSSSLLALTLFVPLLLASVPFVFGTTKEMRFSCACSKCREGAAIRGRAKTSRVPKYVFFGAALLLLVPLRIVLSGGQRSGGRLNPYEVLGVGRNAGKDEIKKSYRINIRKAKMTKGDPDAKKQAIQDILQARTILCDDKLRETWDAFGDTSNKRSQEIAIPEWLMSKHISGVLLVVYISILGFLLPKIVSRHWKKLSARSLAGVSYRTVENLYEFVKGSGPGISLKRAALALAVAEDVEKRQWGSDLHKIKEALETELAIPVDSEEEVSSESEMVCYSLYVMVMAQLGLSSEKVLQMVDPLDLKYIQSRSLRALVALKRVARALDNKGLLQSALLFEKCLIQSVPDPLYWEVQYPGVKFSDVFVRKYVKDKDPARPGESENEKKEREAVDREMFRWHIVSSTLYVPGMGVLRDHGNLSLGSELVVRVVLSKSKEGQAGREREGESEEETFYPEEVVGEESFIRGNLREKEVHAPLFVPPQKYRWVSYLFANDHVLAETKEFSDAEGEIEIFYKVGVTKRLMALAGRGIITLGVSVENLTFFDRNAEVKRLVIVK
jgi:DnaJ domain